MSLTKDKMAEIFNEESGLLLTAAYSNARRVVIERFGPRVWFLTECCLSVFGAMFLKDIKNPIGLILVDAPSTEKTTVLNFFYPNSDKGDPVNKLVYVTDGFTPKSFVSHSANVKRNELEKVDLLPRIRDRIMIVPELAPVFSKREDDLTELIGILTRVFDGEGLETDSGVHGRRGYKGKYFFTLMGATTPLDKRVWKVMGKLGSRLIFLTVDVTVDTQEARDQLVSQLMSKDTYSSKVRDCQRAVHAYMSALYKNRGGFNSCDWDQTNPDDAVWIRKIAILADFVAKARSNVNIWREGDSYEFKIPVPERPIRLASILCNVARGHALLDGRDHLDASDMRVVYEIGMSSMPNDNRSVLSVLMDQDDGSLSVGSIEEILSVSPNTARRIMETLAILKICRLEGGGASHAQRISLASEFEELLSAEFKAYRFPRENSK